MYTDAQALFIFALLIAPLLIVALLMSVNWVPLLGPVYEWLVKTQRNLVNNAHQNITNSPGEWEGWLTGDEQIFGPLSKRAGEKCCWYANCDKPAEFVEYRADSFDMRYLCRHHVDEELTRQRQGTAGGESDGEI